MADPLSIAASVVGVVIPALHGTRLLLDDLNQLADAPNTVKRLINDVSTVDTSLKLLQDVKDREWESLGTSVAEYSKMTISSCTQACDLFRTNLKRWTRHSEDGKLAWQDRATVGFFKQGQIKAMAEQLQNCKATINTLVSIANLYSFVNNSHAWAEIKKSISAKQAEVSGAITVADKQLVILENRLEDMHLYDEEATATTEDKAEALRQLEEERRALDTSRKLLDELLSKSQEEAVAKAAGNPTLTSVTFGAYNSGFQAGTITGGVSGITFGGK